MSETSKPRSSSIDLGAAVVVKRDGELQGQRGSVVDRKQGWYRVQLDGSEDIKSFRWAELSDMQASSPGRPPAARSQSRPQSASPSKRKKESPEAAAAAAAATTSSSTEGLPPRHPSTAPASAAALEDEDTVATRRTARGRASPGRGDDKTPPASAAAARRGGRVQPDRKAAAAAAAAAAATVDEEETETDDHHEGGDSGDESGGGSGGEDAAPGEAKGEAADTAAGVERRGEEEQEEEEEEEEEDEEDEGDVDIDAMIKLAAAAAQKHHTSTLARASSGGGRGGSGSSAAAGQLKRPLTGAGAGGGGSGTEGGRVEVARKRPRVSGVAPRTLDSGLESPKYLNYGGTGKGGNLTASVSSGVVDGGKAAKLMAGSALYSGRDRAMLLERTKAPKDDTAGKGWFNMEQAEMTPELKRDLQVIRMRNYVDPKRFYKASDKVSKFMQIGTVKEGPAEYFSSRMTNKERKKTLVDELLVADDAFRAYSKNQYGSIQSRKRAGGKAAYNEQRRKRKGGAKWKP